MVLTLSVPSRLTTRNVQGLRQALEAPGSVVVLSGCCEGLDLEALVDDAFDAAVIDAPTPEQLWQRVAHFLDEVVPVAEQAGVRLAAHPDDPPVPTLRHTPRLVHQPHLFQRLLDLHQSPANALEFCLGTLAEMTEGDIYDATRHYARQDAIAYVHLRNVRGKVPRYEETFIDEGDVDKALVEADLLEMEYRAPFLAHATMEPMNATAFLRDGRLDVWAGSQFPTQAQKDGVTTFIEVILNQELGEPFRRDAMKKPVVVAGIEREDMRPQQSV